jgi:2-C-methyl-D-erythritol 4-phosphate cytidylyltransferase
VTDLALAVVSVSCDDQDAPGGCAGRRDLGGRSLVARVVDTLVASGRIGRVIVAAPPGAVEALAADLGADAGPVVEVRGVAADGGTARLLAVLEAEPAEVVVVHDVLYPLAPVTLVADALDALAAAPSAVGAVPLGPVTDTLKRIDADGAVVGTVDRDAYRTVHVPQAYRAAGLRAALRAALQADPVPSSSGPQLLVQLVRCAGGPVVVVQAPADAVRVDGADSLLLAEGLLER